MSVDFWMHRMVNFFFPRDKQFWLYHCGVLAIVTMVTVITTLLWSKTVALNLFAVITFIPLLSLATLYFRWIYKTTKLQSLSVLKLTPFIILYGTFFGFLITTINFILLLPAFSDDLIFNSVKQNPSMTIVDVVIKFKRNIHRF